MLVAREVKSGLVLLMAVLAYVVGYGWGVMLSVQILLHGYGSPEGRVQARARPATGSSSPARLHSSSSRSCWPVALPGHWGGPYCSSG